MATSCTEAFKAQLLALGEDHESWAQYFQDWTKLLDPYDDEFFGKDSAYATPTVGGKRYVLRHVHLKPFEPRSLRQWESNHWFRTRKTSNRILVYASDKKGNYLLIFILSEPTAHNVAQMRNAQDKAIMEGFALVAEAFMHDGSVIA